MCMQDLTGEREVSLILAKYLISQEIILFNESGERQAKRNIIQVGILILSSHFQDPQRLDSLLFQQQRQQTVASSETQDMPPPSRKRGKAGKRFFLRHWLPGCKVVDRREGVGVKGENPQRHADSLQYTLPKSAE